MSRSFGIVGAGAVGLYYGGRLAAAGEEVRFLLRSDYEGVKQNGITAESIHGDFKVAEPRAFRTAEEMGPVDVVIIAWKATSNGHYEEVLSPLLHDGTTILTLQNGLGNTETLADLFGAERILGGLCFVCINRVGPGTVRHTGGGLVTLGDFGGQREAELDELVEIFAAANIEVRKAEDLGFAQWLKLVWNVPFNGLCIAEGGIDTEELLQRPGAVARVRALMHEVLLGARALGYEIPKTVVDEQLKRTYPMGPYRPSSMIDYVEGRPVEVEAIFAEPLRRAREAGALLPEWERLLTDIRSRIAGQ
jgi:2-dehydropantoate 2-reductase